MIAQDTVSSSCSRGPVAPRGALSIVCSAALLVALGACGDSGDATTTGSGGGTTTGTGGEASWTSFCEDTYCAERAEEKTALGCDGDGNCAITCNGRTTCREEFRAFAECAMQATAVCSPPDPGISPTNVDVAPGECVDEYNTFAACDRGGACDPLLDEGCAPLKCPNGEVVRLCSAGTCVTDPSVACGPTACQAGGGSAETCPTVACPDGSKESGCMNDVCTLECG